MCAPLEKYNLLELIDGYKMLTAYVNIMAFEGHTPGH